MLILTRKISEKVYIGDDISVTVLEVMGRKVRLGFDAPRDVSVHREEVYNRTKSKGANAETRGGLKCVTGQVT